MTDYYQHTELQSRFLELLPKYEGDFDGFWEKARESITKMDRMIGCYEGHSDVSSTDIGKLMFRVYTWLKPMVSEPPQNWGKWLAEPPANWAEVDLSRYHAELMKANPYFGFGIKGMGEYEAKVEGVYRIAKEQGLAALDNIDAIEASIDNATKYAPKHRIISKVMKENGIELNNEKMEMLAVGEYKRIVAEIMLEDCEHKILQWFEDMYLSSYEADRDKIVLGDLSEENRDMRKLFLDMYGEYEERRAAREMLR